MPGTTQVSRRRFLGRAAVLASAGVASPAIVPRAVLGTESQPAASERIGVAYIGCGRRGNQLLGLPPEGRVVAAARPCSATWATSCAGWGATCAGTPRRKSFPATTRPTPFSTGRGERDTICLR